MALDGVRHGSRVFESSAGARKRDRGMSTSFQTDEERELIETLAKVEALFADTGFAGERNAAATAIDRIRERLRRLQADDKPIEMQFSMRDSWSCKLFTALLRRYEIRPYRYSGQRYTTVMARLPKRFADETLWPEFVQLSDALEHYLEAVTNRLIKTAIFPDSADAETRAKPAALSDLRDAGLNGKPK